MNQDAQPILGTESQTGRQAELERLVPLCKKTDDPECNTAVWGGLLYLLASIHSHPPGQLPSCQPTPRPFSPKSVLKPRSVWTPLRS
jgi:hypothetical protein